MSQRLGPVAYGWIVLLAFWTALPVMGQRIASTAGSEASPVDCTFLGSAKSIRVEKITVAEKGQKSRREPTAFCTFARNGSQLDTTYFSDEGEYGKHAQHFRYLYDSEGRQREIEIFDDGDYKHPTRHVLSKRDVHGRVTETEDLDPDGALDQRIIYQFDGSGDIVKELRYLDTEQIDGTIERRFDSRHHVVWEESNDVPTGRATDTTYKYNGRGQELKKLFRDGKYSTLYVSTYDPDGRLSDSQTIIENAQPAEMLNLYGICGDCGESPGRTIYRYDRRGLLIEEYAIQPSDRLVQLRRYAYDEHGYRTKDWRYQVDPQQKASPIITLSVDGRIASFSRTNGLPLTTYTYDAQDNWIKAVTTEVAFDQPDSKRNISEVLVRKIGYY